MNKAGRAQIMEWPVWSQDGMPRALWSAQEIAQATGGTLGGSARDWPSNWLASNVATDSREISQGGLFFAMRGEAMDGHRFIPTAMGNGAMACVVEHAVASPHVLVADSFAALQALGQAARDRLAPEARVVGVTGSVGKTSVKEALFAALDRASHGRAHRSVKSYNNHVGVPLSLARTPAHALYGVYEMGMNHAGEIAGLTTQVRPHVALITAIAPAHIENLGSEEAIADAKAEVFAGLQGFDGAPGGVAVLPADSPHYDRLRAAALDRGAQVVGFGRAAHAHARLLDALPMPGTNGRPAGSLVTAVLGDVRLCYTVGAAGEHWVLNSLAVLAAAQAVGADLGAAGLALAELKGLAGRGERHDIATADGGLAVLIDESYNANPASMRSTLAVLAQTPARRRMAVLGAMKELGDFGPSLHAALANPLTDAGVDFALLVGAEMGPLAQELAKRQKSGLGNLPAFAHCQTVEEARVALEEHGLSDGDAILVKGSNSVGLGRLVAAFVGK